MSSTVPEASSIPSWRHRVGQRRAWRWRGWQIHYTYAAPPAGTSQVPILLLHGFGASIGHWRHNIPQLSQQHPVYALDLLGFGASEKAATNYDTALWVDQVYDFWRAFINQPVIVVGHSLGSTVGLALAAEHPEMLKGLVMFTLPDASVLDLPSWTRSAPVKAVSGSVIACLKRAMTFPPLFAPLFRAIRRPQTIQSWATSAYSQADVVDRELVDVFSRPAYDRGARRALSAMVNAKPDPQRTYAAREILPHLGQGGQSGAALARPEILALWQTDAVDRTRSGGPLCP
jgi:pimeloyl-ACP methyl ester carboxylesterase